MNRWVDVTFDCLPLRSVGRLDIPIDASPKFRARCERIKSAIENHGSHNSFYLHNARCIFHLTNDDEVGMLEFRFEGTVLTDAEDKVCDRCDLQVDLVCETCDWLAEPAVKWFADTVQHTVAVEFNRFIDAGDLDQAKQRVEQIQTASDEAGGYLGMYL